MTKKQAIEKGFNHSGYMFDNIPVFVKLNNDAEESFEAVGTNLFYNIYLSILTWFDLNFFKSGKSFEIWLNEE